MVKNKCPKPAMFPGPVRPLDSGEEAFQLTDNERQLFDNIAKDQIDIAGTEMDFFSQRLEKTKRDPLYDEPLERNFSKPFRVKGWVSWASSAPVLGQEGFRLAFQTVCWIPRAEIERVRAPAPFEGDIIRFWNTNFFRQFGVAGEDIKNAGYFFDVVNADTDGHINDTATFVGFKLDLKRRSEFGAERRISPP